MHYSNDRRIGTAAATLLLAALIGCSGGSDKDQVAKAKAFLAKNDRQSAILELKTAIQINPAQAEARYLLGSALLLEGDAAAAEVELRKALDAKHAPESVVPLLARALLMQGQGKRVVDEFATLHFDNPQAEAGLQTALASAYLALGHSDQSQAALAAALAADSQYAPALILSARRKAVSRDFDGALVIIEGVIEKAPGNAEAQILKGDILQYALNKPVDAEAAYRRALEADPKFLPGHFALLTLLMRQGQLDKAGEQLARVKQFAAQGLQTKFFEAQLAYEKKDLRLARDLTQQLLRAAPKNPYVLQLAGAVELRLGAWVQAETYLTRATLAAPDLALARRLLIITYMRSGQSRKALAMLEAAFAKGSNDPALYPIAGEIYLQNGDTRRAEEYFVKSLQVDPADAGRRAALALMQVQSGRVAEGLSALTDISASDKSVTADLALISVHTRRNELDKALAAIDRLEAKQPDKPTAANLRGRTLLVRGDIAGARRSFERALAIDPDYFPATSTLAAIDVADKKPDQAKKRFEALLAKNPKNVQALLALASLAGQNGGGKDEVAGLLTRAVDADPTDIGARLALIDLLLRYRDTKQAMVVAQNGVSTLPESPELLFALGRVQQMSGELNQAISTYGKLAALQPLSPKPHIRLAEVQVANRDNEAARRSLRKALEIKPDDLEAQRALVGLDLRANRYADARKTALAVQSQSPKSADGFVLEGDIENSQKNWAAAASAYRAALQRKPAPEVATKLHAVLLAAGKNAEADAFSAGWIRDQPKNSLFLAYLGETALTRKNYPEAERYYVAALKITPDNPVVLNNLAWVTGQLHKAGAVEYAEKAVSLSPKQPRFLDTLAMLLADKGDFASAIEWQTKALALQPGDPSLRLNMAKIYIRAGDKTRARADLETLAKLGDRFASQNEVKALLGSL